MGGKGDDRVHFDGVDGGEVLDGERIAQGSDLRKVLFQFFFNKNVFVNGLIFVFVWASFDEFGESFHASFLSCFG